MTDPTPTQPLLGPDAAASSASPRPRRRWLLPAAAIVLVLFGAAALLAALLGPASASTGAAASSTAPTRAAAPSRSAVSAQDAQHEPISKLADPAWVKRISGESNIPQRALAAYAGAALSVAQTDPSCGIGWNTLAAIGQVESDHGSLNGARLDRHGVATPTIVGPSLDGNGTLKVPDTDQGQYDGDPTWDHAVGPMQFIPSTWAQVGQDGNRDGKKDVNQIDDASLAAAQHLCSIGGDLTVPQNWINAIGAYNDSADYNNKVAAVATQYGSLR
jgi:membrane-bound lytic murein transglycosylase B